VLFEVVTHSMDSVKIQLVCEAMTFKGLENVSYFNENFLKLKPKLEKAYKNFESFKGFP
jgi:hypothetical protein